MPKSGKIIAKSLGSHWVKATADHYIGIFPKVLDSRAFENVPREPVPILFQEYVQHDAEYRVYVIGDQLVSFEIRNKQTAQQLWKSPESLTVRKTTLPKFVENNIKMFQYLMHLDYGAIDLLHSCDGNYTFLEVNLSGDWNYFEKRSNCAAPVRKAIGDLLVKYMETNSNNTSE